MAATDALAGDLSGLQEAVAGVAAALSASGPRADAADTKRRLEATQVGPQGRGGGAAAAASSHTVAWMWAAWRGAPPAVLPTPMVLCPAPPPLPRRSGR